MSQRNPANNTPCDWSYPFDTEHKRVTFARSVSMPRFVRWRADGAVALSYGRVMASSQQARSTNRLLEALPARDRRHMLGECEAVRLIYGEAVHTTGNLNWIYFPTSGFISLIMTIDGPASLEVGLIGDEGVCGFQFALGVDQSPLRAVVQGGGSGLRIDTASFARQLTDSKPLARLIDRYVYVQLSQLAQLAACTRFHVVEQRLARWLLMTQDRAHADTFFLTHQLLGAMLGVRRVGITKAAGALQELGLIRYSRGTINVLDRRGLRAASCGCYEADRKSYARAFG